MPRRRPHRNHRAHPAHTITWEAYRAQEYATPTTININEPVRINAFAGGIGGGSGGSGQVLQSTEYTLRNDNAWSSPRLRRRPAATSTLTLASGEVVQIEQIFATSSNAHTRQNLRQFIATHQDGFYPRNVRDILHPENTVHSGFEVFCQATINGGIDHERETKRLSVVGVVTALRVAPQLFVGAVHPDLRRQGIGRALFDSLRSIPSLMPSTWMMGGIAHRDRAEAFFTACGLSVVESGIDAVRWGSPRNPQWWE